MPNQNEIEIQNQIENGLNDLYKKRQESLTSRNYTGNESKLNYTLIEQQFLSKIKLDSLSKGTLQIGNSQKVCLEFNKQNKVVVVKGDRDKLQNISLFRGINDKLPYVKISLKGKVNSNNINIEDLSIILEKSRENNFSENEDNELAASLLVQEKKEITESKSNDNSSDEDPDNLKLLAEFLENFKEQEKKQETLKLSSSVIINNESNSDLEGVLKEAFSNKSSTEENTQKDILNKSQNNENEVDTNSNKGNDSLSETNKTVNFSVIQPDKKKYSKSFTDTSNLNLKNLTSEENRANHLVQVKKESSIVDPIRLSKLLKEIAKVTGTSKKLF